MNRRTLIHAVLPFALLIALIVIVGPKFACAQDAVQAQVNTSASSADTSGLSCAVRPSVNKLLSPLGLLKGLMSGKAGSEGVVAGDAIEKDSGIQAQADAPIIDQQSANPETNNTTAEKVVTQKQPAPKVVPIVQKKVTSSLPIGVGTMCPAKHDRPGISTRKHKNTMDEDCCPDYDEWPKLGCYYTAADYALMLRGPKSGHITWKQVKNGTWRQ